MFLFCFVQYETLPNCRRMESWKREGKLLSTRAAAIEKDIQVRLTRTKTSLHVAVQLEQEINASNKRRRETINEMALKLSGVKVGDERVK